MLEAQLFDESLVPLRLQQPLDRTGEVHTDKEKYHAVIFATISSWATLECTNNLYTHIFVLKMGSCKELEPTNEGGYYMLSLYNSA